MYTPRALARLIPRTGTRHWTGSRAAAVRWDVCRREISQQSQAGGKAAIEKLPLAGIKVLDMTRVLAGVCDISPS